MWILWERVSEMWRARRPCAEAGGETMKIRLKMTRVSEGWRNLKIISETKTSRGLQEFCNICWTDVLEILRQVDEVMGQSHLGPGDECGAFLFMVYEEWNGNHSENPRFCCLLRIISPSHTSHNGIVAKT